MKSLLQGVKYTLLHSGYSILCQPVDTTNVQPWMNTLVNICYCYYITKYLDLLDTVSDELFGLICIHEYSLYFAFYIIFFFDYVTECLCPGELPSRCFIENRNGIRITIRKLSLVVFVLLLIVVGGERKSSLVPGGKQRKLI